eukprot:SAG11_NODE_95_length_17051_cov_3.557102_13_plen_63_part_00
MIGRIKHMVEVEPLFVDSLDEQLLHFKRKPVRARARLCADLRLSERSVYSSIADAVTGSSMA